MYSKKLNGFCCAAALALSAVTLDAANYYVSKSGNDSNDGSVSAPFLTLQKAAETLVAGDTCYIREGVYEETLQPTNSGTSEAPITFTAFPGEDVVITAMQALDGWSLDADSVYKATVGWDLGQKNFVMYNGVACEIARWPNNVDGDIWTLDSLRNTGGSGEDVIQDAYIEYSDGIPDHDWSEGGSVFFYGDRPGSGWLTWRAFITSSTPTRVTFELDMDPAWIRTAHPPSDGGEFFLEGTRAAVDYDNEWYFDSESSTLYLQIPGGGMPGDGEVSMRKRELTVDLRGRSYVHIKNITVRGGEIQINGDYNRLLRVTSYYGNFTRGVVTDFRANSTSVFIQGRGNLIDRCDIGFGSGSGVWDQGFETQILNNYVHDFNFLGLYDAVLMTRDGQGSSKVIGNTFARGGRDAVQMLGTGHEFAYNDVSYSNLIADDCALFYTLGGPRNIEIHHNWFHDAYSHDSKEKAAGIYLDNDSEGFDVHHNVVWNTEWSSIQINWNGTDINIYNNTLWNGSRVMGAWHRSGTAFSNVKVYNNLSDDDSWEPQSDKQNNITISSGGPFVDLAGGDFRLLAASEPIDAGRVVDGYTEGFIGAAPDVGAYEFGGDAWVAGIDWEPASGPILLDGPIMPFGSTYQVVSGGEELTFVVDSVMRGVTYQLQSSTDLVSWKEVQSRHILEAQSNVSFGPHPAADSGDETSLFYRIVAFESD